MPKYKNNQEYPIFWKGSDWAPGEEKQVPFFVPSEAGLTKTGATPATDPVVLVGGVARTVEAGVPLELDIPYPPSGRMKVSVLYGEGSCSLYLGDGETPVAINPGDFQDSLPWERCPSLRLESSAGATVYVLVTEKV